jgi:hypothetical protein
LGSFHEVIMGLFQDCHQWPWRCFLSCSKCEKWHGASCLAYFLGFGFLGFG